ncbi:MAG: hypothetical protein J0H55_00860 [Chitinophagaceae bacterium]|nr:hypothetical protein [Chitinophagaceae bacterium]
MKKVLLTGCLTIMSFAIIACPVCEKQQPKLLRGITHGTGPSSNWDYVIIMAAVLVVLATLFFAVKYLVKPGEKERNHIKRTILNFN